MSQFYVNPFSTAIRWSAPDGKGVYCAPHTASNPDGWGEPRKAEDGTPISPGTVGGPHARGYIHKEDDAFDAASRRYHQKAGNITWWGKDRDGTKPEKGKHVLSYHGPRLRYFREAAFRYGDSPDHNEIYYQGAYAAIAPAPVLGACIRLVDYTDPVSGAIEKDVAYIYAFVSAPGSEGKEDRLYRKRWGYRRRVPYKYDDAYRQAEMALHDPQEAPRGWELLGTYPKPTSEHINPDTPWFFNESGTEALCMRSKEFEFDNGGGVNVTERVLERWVATINEIDFTIANLNNLPPFEYSEEIDGASAELEFPDSGGNNHFWRQDSMKVLIGFQGEQYICCDYVADQRYWGKIQYDIQRYMAGYYTVGVDFLYNGNVQTYSAPVSEGGTGANNSTFVDGYNYWEEYIYENIIPTVEGNGHTGQWVKFQDKITLFYGPEGDATEEEHSIELFVNNTGTSLEWAGFPKDDSDQYVHFYEYFTRYPRGLFDMRGAPVLFTKTLHEYALRIGDFGTAEFTQYTSTEKHQDVLHTKAEAAGLALGVAIPSRPNVSIQAGWIEYPENETSGTAMPPHWTRSALTSEESATNPGYYSKSWHAHLEPFTEDIFRTTYTGQVPEVNLNEEISIPGSATFYDGEPDAGLSIYAKVKEFPPSIDELLHGAEAADCKGNGVRTEFEHVGIAVEVPVPDSPGAFSVVSYHDPGGEIAELFGFGELFYPVGAC